MTTPVPTSPVGPLTRALIEALESVAARHQVRSLLRQALLGARLEAVPEEPAAFMRFSEGTLRMSLERTLGAGTAEIVVEQLAQLVARIAPAVARQATGTDEADDLSGERIVEAPPVRSSDVNVRVRARPDIAALLRPPEPGPLEAPVLFPRATSFESGTKQKRALARVTQPGGRPSGNLEEVNAPSSGPRALATDVIVCSLDPRVVGEVEGRLRGRSRVRGVVTLAELREALGAVTGGRVAVVLDTGVPSVDVPTFVSLGSALPPGTHVVLWGTDERHKQRLVRLFPQVAKWSASNACESPVDVLLAE